MASALGERASESRERRAPPVTSSEGERSIRPSVGPGPAQRADRGSSFARLLFAFAVLTVGFRKLGTENSAQRLRVFGEVRVALAVRRPDRLASSAAQIDTEAVGVTDSVFYRVGCELAQQCAHALHQAAQQRHLVNHQVGKDALDGLRTVRGGLA